MEHVEDPSEEEIEYCTPPEIQNKAHDVSLNLLPAKSRGKYELQYIVYYATRFINGTLDTRFMLGTSEA
jgi:hypothetical protein